MVEESVNGLDIGESIFELGMDSIRMKVLTTCVRGIYSGSGQQEVGRFSYDVTKAPRGIFNTSTFR